MRFIRGASEWSLMVALVFGAGAVAQAQNVEEAAGPVIQIGKSDTETPNLPAPNDGLEAQEFGILEQPAAPKFWIGLAGGAIAPDHVLRAFVDIPEKQGLLVVNVVPDSPAAKAGIKPHDILLRANDHDLHEMADLVNIVIAEGEKKGQIALEILRKGGRESVSLTPEDRPADAPQPQHLGGGGGLGQGFGMEGEGVEGLPQLLQQFGGRFPMEFRNLGPGVIVGGSGMEAATLPNGVSVTIRQDEGQPKHITVTRGDETWEVTGDNPESLQQLPEDVRPAVEQMLHGGGMGIDLGRPGRPDGERVQERLERMEKRMQDLMQRLEERGANTQPQTDETK